MKHSNQKILTNFLNGIIKIVSEGSSEDYAVMVLMKFNKKNIKYLPFVKYLSKDSKKIIVDQKINSIDSRLVARFINKLINSLF